MEEKQITKKIDISGVDQAVFLGFGDKNLKRISGEFSAKITARGSTITIQGDRKQLDQLEKIFTELLLLYHRNKELSLSDVEAVIAVVKNGASGRNAADSNNGGNWETILFTKHAAVRPRTPGQAKYFSTVAENDLIFAIGPAGTGKTYLAVAIAVAHLRDRLVSRIVLARPAVEAGESLGYLPGDLLEKVDPYLRPLYDALGDMLPQDKLQRYLETRIIEVVPLAYMRGRTLNNSFVILDEAQNTTPGQMKMFLTRLGINSKAIVTGDITQIDLPTGTESGLVQVQYVLADVPGVEFVYLQESDVVRHRLVREIIKAYDSFRSQKEVS